MIVTISLVVNLVSFIYGIMAVLDYGPFTEPYLAPAIVLIVPGAIGIVLIVLGATGIIAGTVYISFIVLIFAVAALWTSLPACVSVNMPARVTETTALMPAGPGSHLAYASTSPVSATEYRMPTPTAINIA